MTEKVDVLFEMRNNFYVGKYQAVINEGLVLSLDNEEANLKKKYPCLSGAHCQS